jgi:hypothetical protein
MQIDLPDLSKYSNALNGLNVARSSGKVIQILGVNH